jgi:hypothetical protein
MPAHSTYTPEVGDKICERVAMGESITDICLDSDMPSRVTVWRWLKEVPEFETNHMRAREAQADVMDEKIMTTADACTAETAAADRVKIGAYQWRASRLNSRRYGEKLGLGHADGLDPVKLGVSVEFVKSN